MTPVEEHLAESRLAMRRAEWHHDAGHREACSRQALEAAEQFALALYALKVQAAVWALSWLTLGVAGWAVWRMAF